MLSRELQSGKVVPKVMHIIEKYKRKYHKYTVEGVSDSVFCALNRYDQKYFVDIVKLTCSCIEWQVSGIPCIHAVAVITPRREPWIRYCSPFYSVELFRATYQGYIFPLQNQEDWEKGNETVKPPHVDR